MIFLPPFSEGFKSEAERCGYDMTFINHHIGRTAMSYLEHCRYRNVDGICLACVDFHAPEVQELAAADLPCVSIDHAYPGRPCVLSENLQGMEALVHRAFSLGHRKIAYVHGQSCTVTDSRIAGYRRAMASCGLAVRREWLKTCVYFRPDRGRGSRPFPATFARPAHLHPDARRLCLPGRPGGCKRTGPSRSGRFVPGRI